MNDDQLSKILAESQPPAAVGSRGDLARLRHGDSFSHVFDGQQLCPELCPSRGNSGLCHAAACAENAAA